MSSAMLIDITRCIGCNACAEACKETNKLGGEIEDQLSARTWTRVREVKGSYVRQMCMHCRKPSCASVCPVGALHATPEGPVAYDEKKCIGCRYCMVACPFGIPTYEWEKAMPRVQKCIGCISRIQKGETPACAAACPAEATVAGTRDSLLAEAHRRIHANPGQYVDHVYGENEVGGTNVMFLSALPFEQLGFPMTLPDAPMPDLTWQALSKIPTIVSVGGLSLLGIWWIIERRMRVERIEDEAAAGAHGAVLKFQSPPPDASQSKRGAS